MNPHAEYCTRGHALTPENTATRRKDGRPYRACRICERARQRKSYADNPNARRERMRDYNHARYHANASAETRRVAIWRMRNPVAYGKQIERANAKRKEQPG